MHIFKSQSPIGAWFILYITTIFQHSTFLAPYTSRAKFYSFILFYSFRRKTSISRRKTTHACGESGTVLDLSQPRSCGDSPRKFGTYCSRSPLIHHMSSVLGYNSCSVTAGQQDTHQKTAIANWTASARSEFKKRLQSRSMFHLFP